MLIQSTNAADGTEFYCCQWSTQLFQNAPGLLVTAAGDFKVIHSGGGPIDAFIRLLGGANTVIIENCETEDCNWFLDDQRNGGSSFVTLIGNQINNAVQVTSIERIVAIGNNVVGINFAQSITPGFLQAGVGLILAHPGAKWQGYGNTYVYPFFQLQNTGNAVFIEDSLSGPSQTQTYYMQGQTMRQTESTDGLGNASGFVSYAYGQLFGRTGYAGDTWTANQTYGAGVLIVAAPDDGYCFKLFSGTTSGSSQPAWNTTIDGYTNDNIGGGNIVWQCIGPSSYKQPFGPPGHMNLFLIPGGQCKRGTVVWNNTAASPGQAMGWVAIRDTVGAVAADWRSFGTIWGSNDGVTPAFGFALQGSVLDAKAFALAQNTIPMGADTDITLSAAQYVSPFLGFAGTITAPRTVTFPSQGSFRAAFWYVNNICPFTLKLTAGSGTVDLPTNSQAQIVVIGNAIGYASAPFAGITDTTGGITPTKNIISLGSTASGIVTLTNEQACYQLLKFTGTLTGNLTVQLPTIAGGQWIINITAVTLGGNTFTLQANGNNWGTTLDASHYYRVVYDGDAGKLYGSILSQ